ncbi:substrate-binding domain-containing protein, partial [Mycobacterium tuberculosis]
MSLDAEEAMIVGRDHEGARAAASHLARLGHQRIAHISGPDSFRSSHERRRGFIDGLAEAGLSLRPEFDVSASYTFESGQRAAKDLLS